MSSEKATGHLFKTGQQVESTGTYSVIHPTVHRAPHHLMIRKGQMFPPCRKCGDVTFLLVYAAPYITEDEDFHL